MVEQGETGSTRSAEETIAEQAAEIQRLRHQLADNRFADQLRQALSLAGASSAIIAAPARERLLTLTMEMAAQMIQATLASIMLVDQEAQEMVIEHAYGPGSEKAVGIRFPLGHGIAGLTAVSGQPMAISDAASDPRHAAEVAERIGYRPNTLLCVPLVSQEQVIGVFQLLDKTRGRTFTTADIDTLGVFAEQAAIAVEQSRVQERLAEVVGQILASQSGESGRNAAVAAARAFARGIEYESPYQEILRSARLLQQIAAFGDQERRLCATILGDLLAYLQSRPQLDLPRAW